MRWPSTLPFRGGQTVLDERDEFCNVAFVSSPHDRDQASQKTSHEERRMRVLWPENRHDAPQAQKSDSDDTERGV